MAYRLSYQRCEEIKEDREKALAIVNKIVDKLKEELFNIGGDELERQI